MNRGPVALLLLAAGFAQPLSAALVRIDPARGVDRSVDYRSLDRFGPWDDRNYQLRAEDVALLAPDEAEQSEPIPAFFRVELRRADPGMRRSGPGQYPRSGLPRFLIRYGGFLIDGRLHRDGRFDEQTGRWTVGADEGESFAAWQARTAAEGAPGVGGAEVRVTNPNGGAESAIAYHPTNDRLVVAGTNGPGGGQKMHWSSDGGATWTQVDLPLGNTCCDPTVAWSSDGAHAYAASLGNASGFQVLVYRSGDNGQSWDDLDTVTKGDPRRELGTNVDKEYLHVDTYPTSPCLDTVYAAWQENGSNRFSRSSNRAVSWLTPYAVSGVGETGFGSDMTTDKSGKVYYFWPAYDQRILVATSTDCGATAAPAALVASTNASYEWPLPSIESRRAWNYVSADADLSNGAYGGSVYVAFADTTGPESGTAASNHSVIKVAWSRDGSAPWTVTSPHSLDDTETVDRWNAWLRVGADGVVHVAYYDTRNSVDRTGVDLYHARSLDGGQTWTPAERLTSTVSPNIAGSFEFGDYNGLDVSRGNLLGIFTDNRKEASEIGDSVDVYAAGSTDRIFADDFELESLLRWSNPPL